MEGGGGTTSLGGRFRLRRATMRRRRTKRITPTAETSPTAAVVENEKFATTCVGALTVTDAFACDPVAPPLHPEKENTPEEVATTLTAVPGRT